MIKQISKVCTMIRPKGIAKDVYEKITGKGKRKRKKKDRVQGELHPNRKDGTGGIKEGA